MGDSKIAFPQTRLRRLRQHPRIRDLVRQTQLSVQDLVYPLFVRAEGPTQPIASMPGQAQLSLEDLASEIEEIAKLNLPAVLLFGIPSHKNAHGTASWQQDGVIQKAIGIIKDVAPELLVISDACFCEYTDHGHCGVISERSGTLDIENDATLDILVKQAISHAEAGADVIAPSGMIDGMVGAIRQGLDQHGFDYVPILSYAAKFASSFYGPFRDAVDVTPQFGDRKTHQIDPANSDQALREVHFDVEEGADMLMVKPANAYLDVIYRVKQMFPGLPLGAYQVSGQYAMIKAAGSNGWLNEQSAAIESLIAIKRAGADFIITYFAKEIAQGKY